MNIIDTSPYSTPFMTQSSCFEIADHGIVQYHPNRFNLYLPKIQVMETIVDYGRIDLMTPLSSLLKQTTGRVRQLKENKQINKNIKDIKQNKELNKSLNCNLPKEIDISEKESQVTEDSLSVESSPINALAQHFSHISDPRVNRRKLHQLPEIITLAICSIICGANNWGELEDVAKGKLNWFKQFMKLEHGIPSHDTFNRVFNRLDPEEFRKGFVSWVQSISERLPGEVIAIDGKQNRRTHDKAVGKKAIHMVSAWATKSNLVLGQIKVDDKSNEITAIPELLNTLYLSGCIITIDAMGCQKKIAQQIIESKADYVLALKNNHKNLYQDVEDIFSSIFKNEQNEETIPLDYTNTVDINHGRVEIRECWTVYVEDVKEKIRNVSEWKDFSSIILVRDERRIGEKVEVFKRYFISSLASHAEKALFAVRSHWQIETSLHWVLDMAFDEDYCRLRTGHGAENFAILRHIALNLVKNENTAQGGIKRRRLKAAVNSDYLFTVLTSLNTSNDEMTKKDE